MSLRPVSNSVPSIINKVCGKKFILLGRVLSQWERIVGSDVSQRAKPVKVTYRKAKGGRRDEKTAILEVAVCSADALAFQHQSGIIIEKINMVLGEGVIGDIKIVHSAIAEEVTKPARGQAGKSLFAEKDLTNEQKSNLSSLLEDVDDPELKDKLAKLGEGVIKKSDM